MKKKFDRSRMKQGGRKSQEHAHRTKDKKGVGGIYSFNIEDTGLPQYKPISDKDKPNKVAFLLYLPGDNDPIQGKAPESEREYTHILDFWDHNLQGSGRYLCMLGTYGKKCPICEYLKNSRTGDEEKDRKVYNKFKATRRGVYAVWDLADKQAGPKVWYTPFNWIEAKVQEITKDPDTGETIYYTDPDEGSNLYFKFIDKGNFNHEYSGFLLKTRKEPIPDEILDVIPSLDQFLVIPEYEDVKEELRRSLDPYDSTKVEDELDKIKESYDDEGEEEKPRSSRRQKSLECPADDGVFGEDFNELTECDDCDIYEECGKRYEKLHPNDEDEDEDDGKGEDKTGYDDEDDPEPEPEKPKRNPLRRRQ